MKRYQCLYAIALVVFGPGVLSAATVSVCDRTPQIRDLLTQTLQKTCDDITDADLLTVTAIRVPKANITELRVGDFSGLSRVETLNLKRNLLTSLPIGVFAELTDLRVLVLLGNKLEVLPNDFTVGNNKLEKIHIFQNSFKTLSARVINNLKLLPVLNVLELGQELDQRTQNQLGNAFPRENERVTLIFT